MTGPLAGVTVLELAALPAAQFTGRILADLGAAVIKVEPPAGDPLRGDPAAEDSRDSRFALFNAGKMSLSLGTGVLATHVLRDLASTVDVVVDSPTRAHGSPWDDFLDRQRVPTGAIRCSVTPFGRTGPLAGRSADEATIQALCGNASMTGAVDGPPLLTPTGYPYSAAAIQACIAILDRLRRRDAGASLPELHIDVAMLDVMFSMDVENVPLVVAERGEYEPPRMGNQSEQDSLAVYRGRDGYIVMEVWGSGDASMWGRLAHVMERPELTRDQRFIDDEARAHAWDDLIVIVEGWLQGLPSDDVAVGLLHGAKIPAARILSARETLQLPYVVGRNRIVPAGPGGPPVIAPPWTFSESPAEVGHAPRLGEHTVEVLRDHLGYKSPYIQQLLDSGTVSRGEVASHS
jgi:crotonobetainyl-CoA:carnitine CoA-transferase CaiB-like acyl-CoA transferase